jgi:hypothetical protein
MVFQELGNDKMPFIPDPVGKFVPHAPEQGNMYTQSPEDIQYSPEGIPLNTSSYGSAPTGLTKDAQQALTSTVSLPINMATGAAKNVAGVNQALFKLMGSNAGDIPVNAINQIEQGTQSQMGGAGKFANQVGSIAGEVAPFMLSPAKLGAPTVLENLGTKVAPYIDKTIGVLPSFLQNVGKNVVLGGATGLATPEKTGLTPEEFATEKGKNIGIQSAVGGVLPIVGEGAKLLASGLRKTLGISTGAGEEAINQAYKAGKTGNQEFLANMRNEVPMENVLNQAKEALAEMRSQRGKAYREGIESTKDNQVFLNFKPIKQAFTETLDSLKSKGIGEEASKVGPDTMKKVNEIKGILNEWEKKPTLHTAGGLDDLKQRLDDVYSEGMSDQAKRILSSTRNAVKNTIVTQDKNYAKTMADYEEALSLEREIEKSLSLGKSKSQETALKKLQSLTRNNVNTDYGFRQELANKLMTQGGKDLMPAISGQALNSWTPRGIVGQGADIGALVAALSNPASAMSLAPMAALTSPRMMGTAAYGIGKASNVALTPEQQKMAKLLIMQSAGKAGQ